MKWLSSNLWPQWLAKILLSFYLYRLRNNKYSQGIRLSIYHTRKNIFGWIYKHQSFAQNFILFLYFIFIFALSPIIINKFICIGIWYPQNIIKLKWMNELNGHFILLLLPSILCSKWIANVQTSVTTGSSKTCENKRLCCHTQQTNEQINPWNEWNWMREVIINYFSNIWIHHSSTMPNEPL